VTDPAVRLLDCHEAAERLHVSVPTVRRYGKSGLIDERRVGPWLIRYTEESVEALKQKDTAA
jgi:predicted site-specific integrase-resolvase